VRVMDGSPPSFHPVTFLRLNARELRDLAADEPPTVSEYLRRVATDWETKATELEAAELAAADAPAGASAQH
jgi:hypothetical protein